MPCELEIPKVRGLKVSILNFSAPAVSDRGLFLRKEYFAPASGLDTVAAFNRRGGYGFGINVRRWADRRDVRDGVDWLTVKRRGFGPVVTHLYRRPIVCHERDVVRHRWWTNRGRDLVF